MKMVALNDVSLHHGATIRPSSRCWRLARFVRETLVYTDDVHSDSGVQTKHLASLSRLIQTNQLTFPSARFHEQVYSRRLKAYSSLLS